MYQLPHEDAGTTIHGRGFESYVGANPVAGQPDFNIVPGEREYTNFPNFSDDFIVVVVFDITPKVVPGVPELKIMADVRALLNTNLPSWVFFRVITSTGFIVDISPVDVTAV